MKYLEVEYGDNDFGWPVERALKRLWENIVKNNTHFPKVAIADLFVFLHGKKALVVILARLVDAECIADNAEFATRGISNYLDSCYPLKEFSIDSNPKKYKSITGDYLNLTLRLHKNKEFARDWKNGEHAYLNLVSGKVVCF